MSLREVYQHLLTIESEILLYIINILSNLLFFTIPRFALETPPKVLKAQISKQKEEKNQTKEQ